MSSPIPARPSVAASTTLTERRKAATRMEIARAAAGLFIQQGIRATRAEDIARAAGIAPRTFYRYFATKEEAVAPLYAAGADRWSEAVRTAPPGLPVLRALEHAVHHALIPGDAVSAASWEWGRTLVRMADTSPALRKVWAQVCREAEGRLAEVLAGRSGEGSGGGDGECEAEDNVAEAPSAPSPALRFAAAVAAAAVRVAVETWAAGNEPAEGPEGPAALAMRNLGALRDFPWEETGSRPGTRPGTRPPTTPA